MKTTSIAALTIVGLVLATAVGSCDKPGGGEPREATAQTPSPTGERHEHGADDPGETAPGTELSDLDRPVEELLGLTCEHEMKTYECDACRFEAGVVRAPADLFTGGLLDTVIAARQRSQTSLRLTGEVVFDDRRVLHLSTQAGGRILGVHVALGDRVRKEQALIEIESATVGEAEGAFLEARAVLQLARSNHQRVAGLRDEAIASQKEYLQSRQELETAEIRARTAHDMLTRLGMSAADVDGLGPATPRGRLVLRARSSGSVLALKAVPGETARPEESLAVIGDGAMVWVWADLHEDDIARVTREQRRRRLPATVSVRAYPGEQFSGIVDLVSPSMDPDSRTVRVRVEVKNPAGRLLAGMFADVMVMLSGDREALALPCGAVLEDEGRSFVFTRLHGEYFVRRPVVLGARWGDRVEVAKGLASGQMVIADGAFLMKSDVLRSKMGAGCAD